jgi:hypothetical protein
MLELIDKVGFGLLQSLSRVMDVCLQSYFDIVRRHLTLQKLAQRAKGPEILDVGQAVRERQRGPTSSARKFFGLTLRRSFKDPAHVRNAGCASQASRIGLLPFIVPEKRGRLAT